MTRINNPLVNKLLWSASGSLAGAVAGAISLRLARAVWRIVRKAPPPKKPEAGATRWSDALLWSGLTGLAGGVVTVSVRRMVASGGRRLFGDRA